MAALNQPKWRKFLSLKGEENKPAGTNTIPNGKKLEVSDNAAPKNTPAEPTPRKRKRTEEEIALRKAKKLKSKGKEAPEWKQLSDDHQRNVEAEQKPREEANPTAVENVAESKDTDENTNSQNLKPDAALLSLKAKKIARSQREEKLQDKKQPQKKRPSKREKEALALEKKAEQVQEYLEGYQKHVDSGDEWKFKKQHQNWIVKHLYKHSWKSDDLVIGYLKTVQGNVRERLIADAQEVVRLAGEDEKAYSEDIVRRAQSVIQALKE